MENYAKYLRLKSRVRELSERPSRLRAELETEQQQISILEEQAAKAAVLEEKNADQLKQKVEDKAFRIASLKEEIAEADKAPAAVADSLKRGGELWLKALDDLQTKYRGQFEPAARAFYRKLKEAEKLEAELAGISDESERMGNELGLVEIVPRLARICIGSRVEIGEYSAMGAFLRDCRAGKINIE